MTVILFVTSRHSAPGGCAVVRACRAPGRHRSAPGAANTPSAHGTEDCTRSLQTVTQSMRTITH